LPALGARIAAKQAHLQDIPEVFANRRKCRIPADMGRFSAFRALLATSAWQNGVGEGSVHLKSYIANHALPAPEIIVRPGGPSALDR
jgi:hypothetical protein